MSFLNLGNVRINTQNQTNDELFSENTYQHSDQNDMLYSQQEGQAYETPVRHEVSGASVANVHSTHYETAGTFYQYVPTAVSIQLFGV